MDFSIKKIMPHTYHLDFGTQYELAMHFLRVQEYYESPKFRKQMFTLVDYMDWYARTKGKGAFTYTKDWSGFNVPSWALMEVYRSSTNVPDFNRYDEFMRRIIDRVMREEWINDTSARHCGEIGPFYFIGTFAGGGINKKGKRDDVLAHEVAHALYYVNEEYKFEVDRLLDAWRHGEGHVGEELDSADDVLAGMGYHRYTMQDEIHAYSATGLCEELKGVMSKAEMEPFQKLFKEYRKK